MRNVSGMPFHISHFTLKNTWCDFGIKRKVAHTFFCARELSCMIVINPFKYSIHLYFKNNKMKKAIVIICLLAVGCYFLSCKKNSSNDNSTSEKQKIFEGEFQDNNGIHSLFKTHDNNFAIVARKGESRQLFVAMLNSSLEILWEKSFGSDIDNAGGIIESNDGGLVIASNKRVSANPQQIPYCLNLLKLNHSGDILWEKNYLFESASGQEYPLVQTADGGFIIGVSYHTPDDLFNFYPTLFKIGQQGDSLWIKAIPDHFNCVISDVGITPDHGFVVSGPCALSRTDSLGNIIWCKLHASDTRPLAVLKDGSTVLLGNPYNDGWESVLTKVDGNGNTIWESTLMTGWNNESFNICENSGNGFVVTEQNNNNVYLIKTDQNGKKISERNLECFSSCGLIQFQNMYSCYTYRLNSSHTNFDLVINLLN